MAHITIQVIKNEDKVSAGGKQYTRCSIKTTDTKGNETWISGFGNATTKSWVKGQTVELDVYAEDYNGKTYYKFKDVAERSVFAELDKINAKLDQLMGVGKSAKQPEVTVEDCEKAFGGKVVGEVPADNIPDFLQP